MTTHTYTDDLAGNNENVLGGGLLNEEQMMYKVEGAIRQIKARGACEEGGGTITTPLVKYHCDFSDFLLVPLPVPMQNYSSFLSPLSSHLNWLRQMAAHPLPGSAGFLLSTVT